MVRELDGKRISGLRELLTTRGRPDETVNLATAPQNVLDVLGQARPANPALSDHFSIVAAGDPGGGALPRSLRAVVQRDPSRNPPFTLVYWNDTYIPE